MTDDTYPLSREDIRADAVEILSALDASRTDLTAYEDNWRRLWQLMREAKAVGLRERVLRKPFTADCLLIAVTQMLTTADRRRDEIA